MSRWSMSASASDSQTALLPPAVKPLQRIIVALGRPILPQVVAHQAFHALGVVDAAHLAGDEHYPRRPGDPRSLVEREGGGEIAAARREGLAQRYRILQCHAAPLGQVLQHRVSRIAEKGDAPERPAPDRLAIGSGPAAPAPRHVEQLPRTRRDAREIGDDLLAAPLGDAPLLVSAAVEGDHDVVLLAPAPRVVDP